MADVNDYVDDVYLYMLLGEEEEAQVFPVSDSKYAEELQLQEVIMSSIITSTAEIPPTPVRDDSQLQMQLPPASESLPDAGPSEFICGICMEPKELTETFQNGPCLHRFCLECTGQHVSARLEQQEMTVPCPEFRCNATMDPERCQDVLPEDVFQRWLSILAESTIPEANRIYCPYRDCSALMEAEGETVITMAVCPHCRRLFCARCGVSWHEGIGCDEFERLGADERGKGDILLISLAREQGWRRCPGCSFYVEKLEGCMHITCRCSSQFCYKCGSSWSPSHNC